MRNDWDLPRLNSWTDYLTLRPPVQAMVQAYLKIKSGAVKSKPEETPDIMHMLSVFPGAIPK